jgi:hypothetical protein
VGLCCVIVWSPRVLSFKYRISKYATSKYGTSVPIANARWPARRLEGATTLDADSFNPETTDKKVWIHEDLSKLRKEGSSFGEFMPGAGCPILSRFLRKGGNITDQFPIED